MNELDKPKTALSASLAVTLITKSPEHAWLDRCEGTEATKEMDFGTVCHELMLGKGDGITVLAYDDWRSKESQAQRDAIRVAGGTAQLKKDYERAQEAVSEWRNKLAILGLDTVFGTKGESEKFLEWTEENGVVCRCKVDWTENNWIWDLKTTNSAHPQKIRRKINDGLYIQRSFNIRGMEKKHPDMQGRFNFGWVFAETKPPFSVTVVNRVDGKLDLMGKKAVEKSIYTWGACLEADFWPGYEVLPVECEALPWAFKESLEEDDEE